MSRSRYHLAVFALAVAAISLAGLAISGCPGRRGGPETGGWAAGGGAAGVPTVRVLIASGDDVSIGVPGPYEILAGDSVLARSAGPLPEGKLLHRDGAWSLHSANYAAEELTVAAVGGSMVCVGLSSYRGKVVFSIGDGGRIRAVNHVNVEDYLAGVLGKELYPSWHIRAYEALAVAARTYAFYEMGAFGATRRYDLRADQSSQVYGGFSAETYKSRQAAGTTRGMVLATGSDGDEKVFRAHYSSSCGGMVNSVYVLYGPPVTSGPLAGGQACDDCKSSSRYRWPAVTVSKDVIYRALRRRYRQAASLGGVKTIEVVDFFVGQSVALGLEPRPVWIDVVGLAGRKIRIRAEDLRMALLRDGDPQARRLYSMNCRIRDAGRAIVFDHGRGFGHGVGLCQWGAQGKAQRGYTVKEILAAYYPGAKTFRAY